MEAARKELGPDGPRVLAIALDGDPERLKNIAEAVGYRGAIAIHDGEGMLDPLGVRSLPGMAFVDAQGTVVAAASGPRDHAFILRQARALTR